MDQKRRMIAFVLSVAMLLGPLCAGAEGISPQVATPSEPQNSATAEPTPEPTPDSEEPIESPAGMPSEAPTETPTAAPTETPNETPSEAPAAETPGETPTAPPEDFQPSGEAWAELEDGARKDGKLQAVLNWIKESGQSATLYLLTRDAVTVKDVELELFESGKVKVEPAEETFGEKTALYEIVITVGEAEPGALPPLSIQAVRKDAGQKPTPEPTPEPSEGPTLEPTEEPTTEPSEEPTLEPTETPTPEPTEEPTPEPTPTPAVSLTVTAEGYQEGQWSTVIPAFTLSGIEEGDQDHVYGVFVCNERLILLANGENTYMLEEQGEISLRFAVLDMMGDIVALSQQYDVRVDAFPPSGPYFEQADFADTIAWMNIYDGESGIEAISYDFGETWEPYNPDFEPYSMMGAKGEVVQPGQVVIRDRAGHTSSNTEEFTFGLKINGLLPSSGGTGGGKPAIKHVKETMDYSLANYNALELKFSKEPVSELVAGDTALALALTGEEAAEGEAGLFTAKLDTWRRDEESTPEKPNALVLSAESSEGVNTWSFTGDVYKLLYNSGIDYLVMTSGEYMTAIPTAGFTGGTQYAKLKASGVSTRKFAYTLCQDEALRETTMSVTVEGETYLLGEERDQPMYRYDVLVGTRDMMRRPYESYMPENARAQAGGTATETAQETAK